ncbi:MAG TPA: hypothetical protein VF395_21780 [Polyangiaceae bacterium]
MAPGSVAPPAYSTPLPGQYAPSGQSTPPGQYETPGRYAPPGQYAPPSQYAPGQYAPSSQYTPGEYTPPGQYAPGQYPSRPNESAPPGTPGSSARRVRSVTLSLSLARLYFPVFEASIEARLANHVGLGVLGGIGSVTPKNSSISYPAKEFGAQLLFYPLEAFDSLVFGGEISFIHISVDGTKASFSGFGSGTAVGPFVGYKLITKGGFTFFAHVGAQYLSSHAEGQDTRTGVSATVDNSQWIPLVDLNLGWSF